MRKSQHPKEKEGTFVNKVCQITQGFLNRRCGHHAFERGVRGGKQQLRDSNLNDSTGRKTLCHRFRPCGMFCLGYTVTLARAAEGSRLTKKTSSFRRILRLQFCRAALVETTHVSATSDSQTWPHAGQSVLFEEVVEGHAVRLARPRPSQSMLHSQARIAESYSTKQSDRHCMMTNSFVCISLKSRPCPTWLHDLLFRYSLGEQCTGNPTSKQVATTRAFLNTDNKWVRQLEDTHPTLMSNSRKNGSIVH